MNDRCYADAGRALTATLSRLEGGTNSAILH